MIVFGCWRRPILANTHWTFEYWEIEQQLNNLAVPFFDHDGGGVWKGGKRRPCNHIMNTIICTALINMLIYVCMYVCWKPRNLDINILFVRDGCGGCYCCCGCRLASNHHKKITSLKCWSMPSPSHKYRNPSSGMSNAF